MSVIWNQLIDCQNQIINIFDSYATEIHEDGLDSFNRPDQGWINRVWGNCNVRRAHIDVVDARNSKGLWMMHVCVFPVLHNNGPIYGFDVIAGKNKMTGAFHDFSPTTERDHPMILGFYDSVENFQPKKTRELPDWAKNIFTDHMLAASNVNTQEEAIEIIRIALDNLKSYFEEIGDYNYMSDKATTAAAQNWYCNNQQKNPHTPAVMKSIGLPEHDVDTFCRDMLFPTIKIP